MSPTIASARERYLDLIEATLRHALTSRPPPPTSGLLTMELALPILATRLGLVPLGDRRAQVSIDRILDADLSAPVFDGAGQTRPAYREMLTRLSAWNPCGHLGTTSIYLKRLLARASTFAISDGPLHASDGGEIGARLLEALTLRAMHFFVAETGTVAAEKVFARVVRAQSPDGRFLAQTSADQLEPAWYHELVVLHAVRLYAHQSGDVAAFQAAARSARYHAEQVQPDHASSYPFGLAALLDDDEGIHLADMMLHAAGVQQPATMDAVSLVLLFDALDCGRLAQLA